MRYYLPVVISVFSLSISACQKPALPVSQSSEPKAVSTSLCGDTYLQAFAPNHIAALSWQSRSPLSKASDAQRLFPQISDSPETVMRWADYFVLFGPGEGQTLKNKLPTSQSLNWTEDFKGIYENALALVGALNLSDAAVKSWYKTVKDLEKTPVKATRPTFLYLTPAGGSAGKNTFVDSAITLAGGQNINKTAGWHSPALETLLHYKPDIIVQSFANSDYYSRSNTRSPVLDTHFKNIPIIEIDGKHWPCAGPGLLEATMIIKDAIKDWTPVSRDNDDA